MTINETMQHVHLMTRCDEVSKHLPEPLHYDTAKKTVTYKGKAFKVVSSASKRGEMNHKEFMEWEPSQVALWFKAQIDPKNGK